MKDHFNNKEFLHEQTISNTEDICVDMYLDEAIEAECEAFADAGRIQSGYLNIDEQTNLYPGLYVIGAISSLGKTTFVHQMCDQMAMNGNKILYFSLEQSVLELVTKSLSRTMAKTIGINNAMTSLQIRKQFKDDRVKEAIVKYKECAKNVTIIKCSFMTTINDIERKVKEYVAKYNKKPIVVSK